MCVGKTVVARRRKWTGWQERRVKRSARPNRGTTPRGREGKTERETERERLARHLGLDGGDGVRWNY